MKRIMIAACTIALATSLLATPSMAVTPPVGSSVPAVEGDPGDITIPSDELSQNAEALAQRLRDKMPFITKYPTLVGNDLVWEADISPMRLTYRKGVSLLDRVGGSVFVGRSGIDLTKVADVDTAKNALFSKELPMRPVTKAGTAKFRVTLPSKVAAELRKVPRSKLASRVIVVVRNDKDIDASHPGYDRTQLTSTRVSAGMANYLAGRRATVEPKGWRRAAPKVSLWRSMPTKNNNDQNTPGTIVVYNGSPFDVQVAWSSVQCNLNLNYPNTYQATVPSNTSVEISNIAQIQGNYTYVSTSAGVQRAAKTPSQVLTSSAISSLQEGALLVGLTQKLSVGMHTVAASFAVGLLVKGLIAAIVNAKKNKYACTMAGSAMNFAWTNVGVGASQSPGNVSYWVPNYNAAGPLVGVPATSLPVVAPGSPLSGYNATSQNGLAVTPQVLAKELGFGGTVTLATLNSDQQNGSYNGFWCNFTNQQIGNPESASSSTSYGSTSFSGGTTASWGPCNATSVPNGAAINLTGNNDTNVVLENEGFTFLIGYSTTANKPAGPAPAVSYTTTATSPAGCIATAIPCAFYTPAVGATPASFGCTPGTWNMLTPWNTSSTTMSLSNPPSSYNSASQLNVQLAFRGVTASGASNVYLAPVSLGGNVLTSFSPSAVASWQLTPANLAAVQALVGPGGSVTEWMCVMTAATTIPNGIPPSATAMNLGWYGVPVIVPLTNPAASLSTREVVLDEESRS